MDADAWVKQLLGWKYFRAWPKAHHYVVELRRGRPWITGLPPFEPIEWTGVEIATTLGSYGIAREFPAGERGLVAIANQVGLTGEWIRDPQFGVNWHTQRVPKMRPPFEMLVDEFMRDLKWVRQASEGYRAGFADVLEGKRSARSQEAKRARDRFVNVMFPAVNDLLGSVRWSPSWIVSDQSFIPDQEYGLVRPPSLAELAIAELLHTFQAERPLRQCKNPDCNRLFFVQGSGEKRWSRSTPDSVLFCSKPCKNHTQYLEKRKADRHGARSEAR